MGSRQIPFTIRFPLDGLDLQILALASRGPFRIRDVTFLPQTTAERRVARLQSMQVLNAAAAERSHQFAAAFPHLASAANDALHERPRLATDFSTPTHLAVLTAFPHPFRDPRADAVVGVSRPTWRRVVNSLRERNLLLRSRAGYEPNPRLPGLAWLLREYVSLYAQAPRTVAVAADRSTTPSQGRTISIATMAYRPIHQRGLEVAWRLEGAELGPNAQPVGPTAGLAPFDVISTVATYAYLGPRRLDMWDHMFLYCLAERNWWRNPDGTAVLGDVSLRAQTLFLAALRSSLLEDPRFHSRAYFYRLGELIRTARSFLADRSHPLKAEVERFRTEFRVAEGILGS